MHASSTITFVDEFVQNQANTNMTLQSINVTANATNGVMASMKQRATIQYPLDNAFAAFLEVLGLCLYAGCIILLLGSSISTFRKASLEQRKSEEIDDENDADERASVVKPEDLKYVEMVDRLQENVLIMEFMRDVVISDILSSVDKLSFAREIVEQVILIRVEREMDNPNNKSSSMAIL